MIFFVQSQVWFPYKKGRDASSSRIRHHLVLFSFCIRVFLLIPCKYSHNFLIGNKNHPKSCPISRFNPSKQRKCPIFADETFLNIYFYSLKVSLQCLCRASHNPASAANQLGSCKDTNKLNTISSKQRKCPILADETPSVLIINNTIYLSFFLKSYLSAFMYEANWQTRCKDTNKFNTSSTNPSKYTSLKSAISNPPLCQTPFRESHPIKKQRRPLLTKETSFIHLTKMYQILINQKL